MRSVQIIMPYRAGPAHVAAFLSNLHGLARSRYAPLDRPYVVIESTATPSRVVHHLSCAQPLAETTLAALRSALPGIRIDDQPRAKHEFRLGWEFTATSQLRPMRTDEPESLSMGVLAALLPLSGDEVLRLQWIVAPAPSPKPPMLDRNRAGRHQWLDAQGLPTSEQVRAQRQKQKYPLLLCVGRIGVAAGHPDRTRHLAARLFRAVRSIEAPGVRLRRRPRPSRLIARRVERADAPALHWPMLLNATELAPVLGLPLGPSALPGVVQGASRQLPVPPGAARSGSLVAHSNYPGSAREIRLSSTVRLQHGLVIGPTGSGKSNLKANLILEDIAAGRGVVVIDPKGDLVEQVADRIPEHRLDDVILLDPTERSHAVGINPLSGGRDERSRDLIVDQVVGTLHNLFRDSWGIRTADILRATVATLVASRAADGSAWTLVDIPTVLERPELRARLIRGRLDPSVRSFWDWYESLSEAQRIEVTNPVANKLRTILLRPMLRRTLGQSTGLDLDQLIRRRQILLVPLPNGLLGEQAASLLGSLVVAQLWMAGQKRAAIRADRRSHFFVYIDEAKDFLHLPVALGDMLAQARGLGLGLTLATQHLAHFPAELREAALANARTKIAFQLPHGDATVLSRLTEPKLTADDLKGLAAYEVAIRSAATGQSFVATGTVPRVTGSLKTAQTIRGRSRSRWASPIGAVDKAIASRQQSDQGHLPQDPQPAFGTRPRDPQTDAGGRS